MPVETGDIIGQDVRKRSKALKDIYNHCFPKVRAFVLRHSGSEEDALDIFQEGVMLLYESLTSDTFDYRSSLTTYLFSICKNRWYVKYGVEVKQKSILNISDRTEGHLRINSSLLDGVMGELKKDCADVLMRFYYQGESIKELQKSLGVGSEQAAKNKKYRCLKYLIALIEKKGLSFSHFILDK